ESGARAHAQRARLEHRNAARESARAARHRCDQRLHRPGLRCPAPHRDPGAVLSGRHRAHSTGSAPADPSLWPGGLRHAAPAAIFSCRWQRAPRARLARHLRAGPGRALGATPLPGSARDLSAARRSALRIPLGRTRGDDARPSPAPARARARAPRRPRLQWTGGRHGDHDGAAAGATRARSPRRGAGLSGDRGAARAAARPERHRRARCYPVSASRRCGGTGPPESMRDGAGMNTTKTAVLTVLVLVNVAFVLGWIRAARRHGLRERPTLGDVAIGVVTDFLDTLGIGSFAPTTALFKFRGRPADELIPGTLNVGHNASAFLETTLFVTSVAVEPLLLGSMVASAAAGAWLGAGVVSGLPRRAIQRFMGVALLIAALFFVMRNLGAFPGGGEAFALEGWRFAVAVGI